MNQLKQILNRYTIKITPLTSKGADRYKATYEELGLTVSGYGKTVADATKELEEVAAATLDDARLDSFPAPLPDTSWESYSGRVTLRVPKVLHAQLDRLASGQGASLNQLMGHILNSAATTMLAGQEFGPTAFPTNSKTEKQPKLRTEKSRHPKRSVKAAR